MKLIGLSPAIIVTAVALAGDGDVFVAADDAEGTDMDSSAAVLETAEAVGLLCPAVAACELEIGTAFGDPWVKADAGDAGYFKVAEFFANKRVGLLIQETAVFHLILIPTCCSSPSPPHLPVPLYGYYTAVYLQFEPTQRCILCLV